MQKKFQTFPAEVISVDRRTCTNFKKIDAKKMTNFFPEEILVDKVTCKNLICKSEKISKYFHLGETHGRYEFEKKIPVRKNSNCSY